MNEINRTMKMERNVQAMVMLSTRMMTKMGRQIGGDGFEVRYEN